MRILIIGYGSIGARHARLADSLGLRVACVSANTACPYSRFASVHDALDRFQPERVIVANRTADHTQVLDELQRANFPGPILIEKPVFDHSKDVTKPHTSRVYVGYNLRFHPLMRILRQRLAGLALHSAWFSAGQYLPQWRPERDYRQSYSASRAAGGGVLRDLSHEIDLALWLCGPAQKIAALGGHFSDLQIDSDDVFSILGAHARCPSVSIMLNYLDQVPQRTIRVSGTALSAVLDFVNGTLSINGETTRVEVQRDDTYRTQLEAFVSDDTSTLCSLAEGIEVVRFITAAEAATATGAWVNP